MTLFARRFTVLISLLLLAHFTIAHAQTPPQPVTPAIPFAETPIVAPIIQPDDARREICSAPYRPDFTAHRVRAGDTLARLLETSAFSPVTIAALNCLDDTVWLPIGAVIWLPADAAMTEDDPESSPEITPEATPRLLPGELTNALTAVKRSSGKQRVEGDTARSPAAPISGSMECLAGFALPNLHAPSSWCGNRSSMG